MHFQIQVNNCLNILASVDTGLYIYLHTVQTHITFLALAQKLSQQTCVKQQPADS